MRRLFQRVERELRGFVEQRDDVALVLQVHANQSPLVLQMLRGVHESGTSLHWSFAEPFADARTYVDSVVASFAARHRAVSELQRKEGEPEWPAIPADVLDTRHPPVERLPALMAWSRRLDEGMGPTVWVFFPLETHDVPAYRALFSKLLTHDAVDPWCTDLRIIVRDAPDRSVAPDITAIGDARILAPDLSTEAMEQALEDDAGDEHLPLAERMQALLQLAALDFSHRRYTDAIEKYALLLRYHASKRDLIGVALALNGLGEVSAATDRVDEAYARFDDALIPALEAQSWPVVLNVLLNVGNLALRLGQWSRAEETYGTASELAGKVMNSDVKLQCLENQGHCRLHMGNVRGAYESWSAAATIARQFDDRERLRAALSHLRDLYLQARMDDAARSLDAEIAALDRRQSEART